jgi:hypothetical protein
MMKTDALGYGRIALAIMLVASAAHAETMTCVRTLHDYFMCRDSHGRRCVRWDPNDIVIRDLTARTPGSFPEDSDICPLTEKPDK